MAAVPSVSLAASVLVGETKKTLYLTQDECKRYSRKGKHTLSTNNEAVIMDGSRVVAHYTVETEESLQD